MPFFLVKRLLEVRRDAPVLVLGRAVAQLRGECRVPVVGALGRRPAGVAGGGADAKRWGNPAGVPRPQLALKKLSPLSTVFAPQLQAEVRGKELQENLTGLGGGRFHAKGGGRFHAKGGGDFTRKGGAISRGQFGVLKRV